MVSPSHFLSSQVIEESTYLCEETCSHNNENTQHMQLGMQRVHVNIEALQCNKSSIAV